jgi:hypothetical protein
VDDPPTVHQAGAAWGRAELECIARVSRRRPFRSGEDVVYGEGKAVDGEAGVLAGEGFAGAEGEGVGAEAVDGDGAEAGTDLPDGLTIVTRNVRDFDGTGVGVVNPWDL